MTASSSRFTCFLVERPGSGSISGGVRSLDLRELPPGELLIEVDWSSLNYKDALAALGHPGVVRRFPHVPGIDAVGRIVESHAADWRTGDWVIVTGNELGAGHWGGWSRYIRVPASWAIPLPEGLSPEESMILGTAGFTAAQCVLALQRNEVWPEQGPIVVTGATGGVGCLAVKLLHHLGYTVVASTGKADAADWLRACGAAECIGREEVVGDAAKPLTTTRWAGAIDTVGGATLSGVVRATAIDGCVAACGMVGGADLPLTVFPFILRGVVLAGVSSQNCRLERRREIWRRLAGEWRLAGLRELASVCSLAELPAAVDRIRSGAVRGRILVDCRNVLP